jgi:hypothetical protein
MDAGRKRNVGRPRRTGRGLGWVVAATLLAAGLAGCPPAGGTRGPQAVQASATPGVDAAQREVGRAFLAAARAHEALGQGDPAAARLALAEAEGGLRAARDAATPAQARTILPLEDRLLVARAALDGGTPRELVEARRATRGLLDAMLAAGPLDAGPALAERPDLSAAPTSRPAGGGAGGGMPGAASGGAGAGGAPGAGSPAAAQAPRAPAGTSAAAQGSRTAAATAAPARVAAAPLVRATPAPPKPGESRRAFARGFAALGDAQREIALGRPLAAVPYVRTVRAELRTARRHGSIAEQRAAAALDVRANQVAFLAGAASPLAGREARRLVREWVVAQEALTGGPGGAAARAARVRRAIRAAQAATPRPGGGAGGPSAAAARQAAPTPEAAKSRRTPPPDPTLTPPW